MKRETIACILLVFAIAPVLVEAAAPAEEYDMRPLADVDVWIDQFSWTSYYWTQLDEGDVIHVDFEVTSGSDIDFFICDGETYDLWNDGNSVTVYRLQENVGSYSTSFSVPSDGEWRVVFFNDNLFTRKHIEGTVEVRSPTSPSNTLLGMAGLGLLVLVIVGIAVVFHYVGKRTKTRKQLPEYLPPPSRQPNTSERVRTNYCPHCGQRLRLPGAQFCSSCGASLSPPPGIS